MNPSIREERRKRERERVCGETVLFVVVGSIVLSGAHDCPSLCCSVPSVCVCGSLLDGVDVEQY